EKCGGLMKRVPYVLDCWFESGSMPYAQAHYPFENKELFEKNFPAQFVAEGIDQTRGWFYTLMVLSTALFDKPAFLNNIVNGIILTEDGQKMSKRLKNYPEPMKVIDQYGADAMRFYLLTSPAIKADDLRFSENGVNETLKKVLMILWNVYTFYKLYAEEDSWELDINSVDNILDKWILSKLNSLNKEVTEGMNEYDLFKAARPIEKFISDLSTWYLRRSRERFKSNERKKEASQTLKYVLFNLSQILAPFIPFFSEQIYQNLKNEENLESVHLCDYPEVNEKLINKTLEQEMEEIRKIASMVLAERAQVGIKVRQPLNELKIRDCKLKGKEELLGVLKDEINIKQIVFDDKLEKEIEIDIKITKELKEEGMMRDCFRQIQIIRQKSGLFSSDEIVICFQGEDSIMELLKKNEKQMKESLRIKEIIWDKIEDFDLKGDITLDNKKINISLKK
ncbi:MAG TPA: class I tRNA ligase family protein, partial [Candidatus Paceibacterota bacterium]|nr:class I tRNA ligase family protein [Candidatus Paceibacterota bacterium]